MLSALDAGPKVEPGMYQELNNDLLIDAWAGDGHILTVFLVLICIP